ncbi:MAG: alfa-L-rhamnosidase RamA, partial [Lachnospiraceae bacterium]|nr:alfa-L-rhamnosidase RamA [Lachnospiraceae bacterium]
RPHFTFYGFRYVKVEGLDSVDITNFRALRIMSDIKTTGKLITSNEKINKLIENSVRSQKCNFLDVPTDCPQRDERMGWTGDICVFATTACSNMDCSAFIHHYMVNMRKEQELLNGSIPFFVPYPKIKPFDGINPFLVTNGASTWGDAASVVPWELYAHNKDIKMLREHYKTMKAWGEYVAKRVAEHTNHFLWQNDMQLGDWLALDNGNINNPIGATDTNFIASAYFYLTAMNCYKAAKKLGYIDEKNRWGDIAANVKEAFIEEYLDESGKIKENETQTAYAVIVAFGLYRENMLPTIREKFKEMLSNYDNHLSTGFVGTRYLCDALSICGLNELAYTLLLNEDYPSWLREVNMGATTIWERWNSLEDDGHISGTGMNSLNHYAYGCVVGWMYEYMCGFRYDEDGRLYINPMPDKRVPKVYAEYMTMFGKVVLQYEYTSDGLKFNVTIPFQAKIQMILPDGRQMMLETGEYEYIVAL